MGLKHCLFGAVLLAVAAVSCSKSGTETARPDDTLYIVDQPTRVSLNKNLKTVWNASDKVSVFYKSDANEEWEFSGNDGATTGVLTYSGERKVSGSDIIALYPYNEKAALSNGSITTFLPRNQIIRPGSFDPSAALMSSLAKDKELYFKYAVGIVRLTLEKKVNADSVVLKGMKWESLAGNGSISDPSDPVFKPKHGAESVRIASADGKPMEIKAGDQLYFCIAPGSFPAGFEAVVYISGGEAKSISYPIPTELAAGHLCDISGSVSQTLTLQAVFSSEAADGTLSPVNPFTEAPTVSLAGSLSKEFHLSAYPDKYPFRFFVSKDAASFRLGINSAGSGLQIGGSPHDYILLPGIEEFSLSSVSIYIGQSAGQYGVSENPASGTPAPVKGGEVTSVSARTTHTFNLSGTQPGTAYRLELMRDASTFIRTLTLVYEK